MAATTSPAPYVILWPEQEAVQGISVGACVATGNAAPLGGHIAHAHDDRYSLASFGWICCKAKYAERLGTVQPWGRNATKPDQPSTIYRLTAPQVLAYHELAHILKAVKAGASGHGGAHGWLWRSTLAAFEPQCPGCALEAARYDPTARQERRAEAMVNFRVGDVVRVARSSGQGRALIGEQAVITRIMRTRVRLDFLSVHTPRPADPLLAKRITEWPPTLLELVSRPTLVYNHHAAIPMDRAN